MKEKKVGYTTVNTYSTLNDLTSETRYVWIVLHGIGFLSRYFLRYFNELSAKEHYILAPQAPSKYYLDPEYRRIGASWLTQEETAQEIENVLSYLDSVMQLEAIPSNKKLIVLGFSQGVSIATRWVARRKIECHKLVLYAGGIPNELNGSDFDFLKGHSTEVMIITGNQDEYLTEKRREQETVKIHKLFGNTARQLTFEGGHEIKKELIAKIIS